VSARLILPDGKKKLLGALNHLREEAETYHKVRRVSWWVIYEYLNGNRDFDDLNYREGTLRLLTSNQTEVDFRLEEVVTKTTERIGQLLRMDTRPKVGRRRLSLDNVRSRSMAQLVLDGLLSEEDVRLVKEEFIPMVVTYGLAGLVAWIEPTLPLRTPSDRMKTPDIEVVPPWEILAVPANPRSISETSGIIRQRWVPWTWLEQLGFGKKLLANEEKIIVRERKYGQAPSSSTEFDLGESTTSQRVGMLKTSRTQKPELEKYVKLNELWVRGRKGTLSAYHAWVDDVALISRDFSKEDDPPFMPIGLGRYSPAGGFYSRGHAELLLPLNVAVEAIVGKLFQNAEDYDVHGTTFFPNSLGLNPAWFEGTDVPRAMGYEPDYTVPQQTVFRLNPAEFGAGPVKAVEIGTALIDRVSPRNVVEDKGRVDSATGLGFLQEVAQIPLTYGASSIAGAYATVYRAMLDQVRRVWPSHKIAIQTLMDDALAGITIDPQTLEVSASNKIPRPDEVEVGIISPFPVSSEQKRRDLYDMLKGGLLTRRWFRIMARKLGLDLPVANEAEWANYRKAQMNNVLLFNDGQTPPPQGTILMNPDSDMVEIHVEVMGAFMARPEFQLASPEVRERFNSAYAELQTSLGRYPDQLKYPELIAEEVEQRQRAAAQREPSVGG